MMRALDFFRAPSVTTEPPDEAHIRRNDWVLLGCVLLLLAAGWLVRWAALDVRQEADLGIGLPPLLYPAGWSHTDLDLGAALGAESAEGDGLLFQARHAAAASPFNSTLRLEALPVLQGATLDTLRADLSLRRSRALERYRELTALPVTVLDGRPALLITFAYIADPTLDSGGNGLPVVVQAQDLLFRHETQWIVAGAAADAAHWPAEEDAFALFFDSLGLAEDEIPGALDALPLRAPAGSGTLAPATTGTPAFQSTTPEGSQP